MEGIITPLLQYSIPPWFLPILGLVVGYGLVMMANPVRVALRDGFRAVLRFKRLWLVFALFALAYSIFQFVTFTPFTSTGDLRWEQFTLEAWHWPTFVQVWSESALHTLESVAGIFDAAATTYPLSSIAAVLLVVNWRGLHFSLVRALRRQFGTAGWLIYSAVLCSALASLLKPLIYWLYPDRVSFLSPARFLQISVVVDTVAFIFEYLCAVYLQVYLITVALAWIKGLQFREGELLRFAVRRFSFVVKWLGLVVLVGTILLRCPLLLAYFREMPGVLDYLPAARCVMAAFIICFATMQISLVLHNETLGEAFRAHRQFVRRHFFRLGWFLLICGLNYWFLELADAVVHTAASGRLLALFFWRLLYLTGHAFLTGWFLASWVSLFRQCEAGRVNRETWIRY